MNASITRIAGGAFAVLLSAALPAADIVIVDSDGVGQNASIAIGADGLPIIGYRGDAALLIAKCTEPGCGSAILETVEDAGGVNARGQYISLAVRAGGSPVMTWYDDINDDLGFARCPNADCSGPDILRILDDAPEDTGRDVSMALDADGRVHVAYVNTTDGALQLARCPALACANPTIQVVHDDPVNFIGSNAAMVLGNDGFPVIAYLDATADELLVARCHSADCSTGAAISVVDTGLANVAGLGPDIAIGADGFPVLSYYDGNAGALKIAKCHGAGCGVAPATRLIDDQPQGDAGYYSAIAVRPDGNPVIAYQRRALGGQGGSGLRVAECTAPDCSGPVRVVGLDFRPGEITGAGIDIAIGADGGAVIAYYDTTTTSLKVAKCNAQTCVGPGDRIFRDGFQ